MVLLLTPERPQVRRQGSPILYAEVTWWHTGQLHTQFLWQFLNTHCHSGAEPPWDRTRCASSPTGTAACSTASAARIVTGVPAHTSSPSHHLQHPQQSGGPPVAPRSEGPQCCMICSVGCGTGLQAGRTCRRGWYPAPLTGVCSRSVREFRGRP